MDIQSLVLAADYQSERQTVFPSAAALAWFERKHRPALDKAGAIVVVNRRVLYVPDRFDQVVLAVGTAAASEAS